MNKQLRKVQPASKHLKCWVCDAEHGSVRSFEMHHVWGISASPLTIALCKRCHDEVSYVPWADSTTFREFEKWWTAMELVLRDRDWRVRAWFLKAAVLIGDAYAQSKGIQNPRYSKKEDDYPSSK